jgi:sugar/nucleoside kinase (ribokinase family)
VCLGEALVDLIRDPEARERECFATHFGGALANVSVAIARAGGPAALAGGTGDDEFGRLLRDRLGAEGVDTERLHVLPELTTPFAFVRLGAGGEPAFRIHGAGIEAGLRPLAGREEAAVDGAAALVIGSNTLSADPGRSVTLAAIGAARERAVPVLFDPNLRPGRWPRMDDALELCRSVLASSFLTKTNLAEARLILGDGGLDAVEAAERLAALGARIAVVTDGPRGAVGRGEAAAEAVVEAVVDPNPIGAGDAFMGALVAELWAGGWRPDQLQSALEAGSRAAAAACRTIGAID